MYVVREKKTKAVLHMLNSTPGVELKPEQVLPGFDPKTMELGRYSEQHLPDHFDIVDGEVKAMEPPKPKAEKLSAKAQAEELEALKALRLADASRRAFEERRVLIPEHELLNAALGIYPEKRTRQIQETVKAFIEEYHRFEAALEKAKTAKDVQALEPKFPTKLQS